MRAKHGKALWSSCSNTMQYLSELAGKHGGSTVPRCSKDLAKHLKSANYSFNVFNEAVVKEALAYLWVKNRPHIDAVEQIRHFLFVPRSREQPCGEPGAK